MLKKIEEIYIDPAEIAALDFRVIETEDVNSEEPDAVVVRAHPTVVLKSGHAIILPNSVPIEAIEKKLEMIMLEIEVGH